MDVVFVADDNARVFVCGNELTYAVDWQRIAIVQYVGACSDVIVETYNAGWQTTALTLALQYDGQSWATGAGALSVLVQRNPSLGYVSDQNYDFSMWTPARVRSDFNADWRLVEYDLMLEAYEAQPVAFGGGSSDGPNRYVYKISPPFCS